MRARQWSTRQLKTQRRITGQLASTLANTLTQVFSKCRVRGIAKVVSKRGYGTAYRRRRGKQTAPAISKRANHGLKVACALAGNAAKSSALSVHDEMNIGRNAKLTAPLAVIADAHSISREALRATLLRQADFLVETQLRVIVQLTSWLREAEPDLQFAFSASMIDEAGQKMKFTSAGSIPAVRGPRPAGLAAVCDQGDPATIRPTEPKKKCGPKQAQVNTVTDVMAARFCFSWKEARPGAKLVALEFIPPPFKLASPGARNLWSVLRHHPTMEKLIDFKRALLQRARFGADVFHSDDASGNDLLHAADTADERSRGHRWGIMRNLCLDHKAHHCLLVPVAGVFSLKYVSSLFRCSVFFGMSTYQLRCVFSLPTVLRADGRVQVTREPVPRSDRSYAEQLTDFLVSTSSGTSSSLAALRKSLETVFFELWNCKFEQRFVIGHACKGESCICGGDSERLLKLLDCYLSSVVLGRCIPRPSAGKWLQLVFCLRQLMLCQVTSLFQLLATTGLQAITFRDATDISPGTGVEDFELDACWHAVAGKRQFLISSAWGYQNSKQARVHVYLPFVVAQEEGAGKSVCGIAGLHCERQGFY